MRFANQSLITHLVCLSVGLGAGIYLSRSNVPKDVAEPVTAVAGENPVPNIPNTTATAQAANAGGATAVAPGPGADPALEKMRADYEEQIRKGESRQALLILQEMEKKAPGSQTYLELNSEYQVYVKDWQAASGAALKCTAAFPKSRTCFRNLATAELQDGSTEEQASAVDSCLALEPNDPQCRNMKGIVLMNGGDYSGAVATYEKLIADNGSYGVRFQEDHLEWQLGLALEGAGRREEAIDHLENACRRNNNQACKKIEEISGGGFD